MAFQGWPPFNDVVDAIFIVIFCLYLFLFIAVALIWCFQPASDTAEQKESRTQSRKAPSSATTLMNHAKLLNTGLSIANDEIQSIKPSVGRRRRQKHKHALVTARHELKHHDIILANLVFGTLPTLLICSVFCVFRGLKNMWMNSNGHARNANLRPSSTDGQPGGKSTMSHSDAGQIKSMQHPDIATKSSDSSKDASENTSAESQEHPQHYPPKAVGQNGRVQNYSELWTSLLVVYLVAAILSHFMPFAARMLYYLVNFHRTAQGLNWAVSSLRNGFPQSKIRRTKGRKSSRRHETTKPSKESSSASPKPSTTSTGSQTATLQKRSSPTNRHHNNESVAPERSGDTTSSDSDTGSSTSEEDDVTSHQGKTVKPARKSRQNATCWDTGVTISKILAKGTLGFALFGAISYLLSIVIAVLLYGLKIVVAVLLYGLKIVVGIAFWGIVIVAASESTSHQAGSQPVKSVTSTPASGPVTEREKRILQRTKPCPMNYDWVRKGNGYECKGGSHYVESLPTETYTE